MSDRVKGLLSPGGAWLMITSLDLGTLQRLSTEVRNGSGLAHTFNSSQMRTTESLFYHLSADLDFPPYFGRNWAAFDECITDLNWLPSPRGYLLTFLHSLNILSDEPSSQFRTLMKIMRNAAAEWSASIDLGEPWDRPAKSFKVILHEEEQHLTALGRRVVDAGVNALVLGAVDP